MSHSIYIDTTILDAFQEICLLQAHDGTPKGAYGKRYKELLDKLKKMFHNTPPNASFPSANAPRIPHVVYDRQEDKIWVTLKQKNDLL
jgi:hypothetical protein